MRNIERRSQENAKGFTRALIAFLIFITFAVIGFFYCVDRNIEKIVLSTISDHVERQSFHLNSILDIQYKYLESLAEYLGRQEEIITEENLAMLGTLREKTDLERVGIFDTKGLLHYADGREISVLARPYYYELMEGRRVLSPPLESQVDKEMRVLLGVPLYKDGEFAGAMGATYNVSTLSHMLFEDVYDGEGYSIIVSGNGTLISCDGLEHSRSIQPDDNFYSFFSKVRFRNGVVFEDIRKDFRALRSNCVMAGEGREVRYMTYAPIGYNEWMLCYSVPVLKAQEEYQLIRRYELILSIILALSAMVLLIRLFRISDRQMKEISKNAQIDALTGTFNKKSTEDKVNHWLESPKCIGIQALLMLDVDEFKEINDIYGHYMGDRVIRQVGRTLRGEFRGDDIIGRIGGDEFVVFMKNIKSRDIAISRANYILERFRKMKMAEIEENNITCSMGLAFSPEHGTDYKELYGNADKALYDTKRNGKNGLTVCGMERED